MSEPYAPPEPTERRRSRTPLVLAALAALLLIAGVVVVVAGDDDGGRSTEDAVALLGAAPDAVRDAGSARIAMAMTMESRGFSFDLSGSGVTEFATGRGNLSISFLGIDLEMISDGDTLYIHVPDGGRLPGTTAPWVAVPADATGSGSSFGTSIQSTSGMLDALRGIAGEVEERGTDEVNGVEATHYHAVVSLRDAIAAAPGAQRAQAEAGLAQLDQLGISDMPVDVWITDDGLPVRQVMTFDAPEGAGAVAGLTMKITIDLTDFGTPVDVQVPPADQVQQVDPAQLGSLFAGSTS